ncbi:MAG: DUF3750 domain-containing protein [Candidatus Paceibacterota bacterium]|jgi:hypothetical protein
MDKDNFGKLIEPDNYQVFLFMCPATLPFSFGAHSWFVINKKGSVSRWEILFRKIKNKQNWGNLYKDFLPPFQGIRVVPFLRGYYWESKLFAKIEGKNAEKMIEFIEKSPILYPYTNKYFLTGPNCNTYVQWIINNFSEIELTLPWSCFGKNHKLK